MPEGDTIFRAATTLRRWLGGRRITGARTVVPGLAAASLIGDRVGAVESRAKHLLIRLDSGRVLHTHMRMTGSWHVYPGGQRWQRPASQARVVLEAGDRVAVCFNAPVVELLAPGMERVHPVLAHLGPDILVQPLDLDEVGRRAAGRPGGTEIGDLLLDQQVIGGIGNIYRCECLFVAGIHPRLPVAAVPTGALVAAVEAAAAMMTSSARPVAGGRHRPWVYGRAGRPCRRCGSVIASARVGTQARTAYWCDRCQPLPAT